jgi:hypothetical protein
VKQPLLAAAKANPNLQVTGKKVEGRKSYIERGWRACTGRLGQEAASLPGERPAALLARGLGGRRTDALLS